MFGDDRVHSGRDIGGRVIPTGVDKPLGRSLLGRIEAAGIVMDLSAQHSLVARESGGDGMIVVGANLFDGAVTGDINNDAATGFAEAAIRAVFGGHRLMPSRGIRR